MSKVYSYSKWLPWLGFLIIAVALFAYYAASYQYHFFWQEQNQIFLSSTDWLVTYFDKPAWLACMAGEYITQFYYYLYVGPAVLALAIAATCALLQVALRKSANKPISWVVTALALAWLVSCSFVASYRLASLLCVTGGVLAFLAAYRLKGVAVAILPLVYWLFGYGFIITAILLSIFAIKHSVKKGLVLTALSAIIVAFTPYALCNYYVLTYSKAIVYPSVGEPGLPESEFEETLAIDNEFYFGNTKKAAQLALNAKYPNKITAFYYYLAQAKSDSLPEALLKYPIKELGTLENIGETTPLAVINMMNDLYLSIGDLTYAERAAMMRNVFSRQNRNVRMIKRLAEINLLSGNDDAARKYLRLLSKTRVYAKWAADHDPSAMPLNIKNELEHRRALVNTNDSLRVGDNCRVILLEVLDSNPDNTLALDYLLCTDLLLTDMDNFKADYDRYLTALGRQRTRSLYQQAMMIYLAGTDAPDDEWQRYITSQQLLDRFRQYSKNRGSKAFADTYWYYFDTIQSSRTKNGGH